MQVSSAPISPRTFWLVNTPGAVPGEASVARNIARSRSLREPGFLVIVAPYRFSNEPPRVTGSLHYLCNVSHGLFRYHGFNKQIFGADKQVPARGQSD